MLLILKIIIALFLFNILFAGIQVFVEIWMYAAEENEKRLDK